MPALWSFINNGNCTGQTAFLFAEGEVALLRDFILRHVLLRGYSSGLDHRNKIADKFLLQKHLQYAIIRKTNNTATG